MSGVELKGLKGLLGLDSLIQDSKDDSQKQTISRLSVDILSSGKYQPRTEIDDQSILELAASIKSQGIIQPLIVRNIDKDQFEIIAGERRWRAAIIAGLQYVPAIVRNVTDETALAFALIENIQRQALNPIDEAFALIRLKEEFSMTHEQIAERVGRSRSAVTNLIRLLTLQEEVRDLLKVGKIEMGHARALLALDTNLQLMAAETIILKRMSVRETEKMVHKIKSAPTINPCPKDNPLDEKVHGWINELTQRLSSNVKIHLNSKGEGKIIIQVNSPDEIEWLIEKIN